MSKNRRGLRWRRMHFPIKICCFFVRVRRKKKYKYVRLVRLLKNVGIVPIKLSEFKSLKIMSRTANTKISTEFSDYTLSETRMEVSLK